MSALKRTRQRILAHKRRKADLAAKGPAHFSWVRAMQVRALDERRRHLRRAPWVGSAEERMKLLMSVLP